MQMQLYLTYATLYKKNATLHLTIRIFIPHNSNSIFRCDSMPHNCRTVSCKCNFIAPNCNVISLLWLILQMQLHIIQLQLIYHNCNSHNMSLYLRMWLYIIMQLYILNVILQLPVLFRILRWKQAFKVGLSQHNDTRNIWSLKFGWSVRTYREVNLQECYAQICQRGHLLTIHTLPSS